MERRASFDAPSLAKFGMQLCEQLRASVESGELRPSKRKARKMIVQEFTYDDSWQGPRSTAHREVEEETWDDAMESVLDASRSLPAFRAAELATESLGTNTLWGPLIHEFVRRLALAYLSGTPAEKAVQFQVEALRRDSLEEPNPLTVTAHLQGILLAPEPIGFRVGAHQVSLRRIRAEDFEYDVLSYSLHHRQFMHLERGQGSCVLDLQMTTFGGVESQNALERAVTILSPW